MLAQSSGEYLMPPLAAGGKNNRRRFVDFNQNTKDRTVTSAYSA
nr:hypothetical protein [Mycobacterium lepromatosis]